MFLFLYVLGSASVKKNTIIVFKQVRFLLIIYSILIFWIIVNRSFNGVPINNSLIKVSSNHIISVLSFLTIVYLATSPKRIYILTWSIVASAVISAIFGIMQYFGFQWFWEISILLHPNAQLLLQNTNATLYGFIPGLALFSIPFSYHLIVSGCLIFPILASPEKFNILLRRRATLVVFIITIAIILSNSRSALLGFILLYYLVIIKFSPKRYLKNKLKYIILFGCLFMAVYSVSSRIQSDQSGYTIKRILSLKDSQRVLTIRATIDYIKNSNLLLGNISSYFSHLGTAQEASLFERLHTPHNLFLNAFVFYGLPGLLLTTLFLYQLSLILIDFGRNNKNLPFKLSWINSGATASILVFTFNSMFHNESFLSGSVLPWWSLGILVASQQQIKKAGAINNA